MPIEPADHRKLAIEANNSTWEILGKPVADITDGEAEEMTRRAYAAAYHWQRAEGSTPVNEARALWLLSRVWVIQNRGELALQQAQRCLAICESAGLVDFDLAYAHEALARSFACLENTELARKHLLIAQGVSISDSEDQAVVNADIAAEPWFNVRFPHEP